MSATAFALALAAAVLHAGWNVLLGGARDVRAATTVTLAVSVVVFAPVAAVTWRVEGDAVPWIAASCGLELVYFALLVTAYSRSDVSLVYPIARGAAPVLVLGVSLVAGATIGVLQGLGVALVGAGVILVRGVRGQADTRGALLALMIAGAIAGYTLVDKEGIEHAAAIPYLELVLAPIALVALGAEVASGRAGVVRENLNRRTIAAALASFAAYALVLAALDRAPAAAVAAVRESGVLFAVVLGALILGESVHRGRLAGAALVVVGVAVVALA